MAQGIIYDIKEFSVYDGPGIRVTVFLKGCPLRCNWCHNPEGLSFIPEFLTCQTSGSKLVGEYVDSKDLAQRLMKYRDYLNSIGGITISGGEPLAQGEFLIELLDELSVFHLVIETSGYGNKDTFLKVIERSDLILFDLKVMDAIQHKAMTNVDNKLILSNLESLINSEKKFIIRVPMIPGITDTRDNIRRITQALQGAENLLRIELLPYNGLAGVKYGKLGLEYKPLFDEQAAISYHTDIFEEAELKYIII